MIRWIPALLATAAFAQNAKFVLPVPADAAAIRKDVAYRTDRLVDVYRPARAVEARPPVLIFLSTGDSSVRNQDFWQSWARAAAANGIVGLLPDSSPDRLGSDFDELLQYIARNHAELGADPERIAVYIASGNVYTGLPLVEDPKRSAVKAAVVYYGTSSITQLRPDLPVLFVRAGLDRPGMNTGLGRIVQDAVAQNVPVTLINYPAGRHAFDLFNDNDQSRDVIRQTLDFVKSATAPAYQAALRAGVPEAEAAAAVNLGDFPRASSLYRGLAASRPADATLTLAYGEALLGARQYKDALAQFDKIKGKVGPRDLGVPAAKAAALDGNGEAAIAWLASIPKRFRPSSLRDEPVFRALRDRPDFLALFEP